MNESLFSDHDVIHPVYIFLLLYLINLIFKYHFHSIVTFNMMLSCFHIILTVDSEK